MLTYFHASVEDPEVLDPGWAAFQRLRFLESRGQANAKVSNERIWCVLVQEELLLLERRDRGFFAINYIGPRWRFFCRTTIAVTLQITAMEPRPWLPVSVRMQLPA